jgi:hypothetical protein
LSFAGDLAFRVGIENNLSATLDLSAPGCSDARPPEHANGGGESQEP